MSARRQDVEGRASCRFCRKVMRSADGLHSHLKVKHPIALQRMYARRPVFIGHDGRPRCNMRLACKHAYVDIGDAWMKAFAVFVERGVIVTPYRCTTVDTRYAHTVRGCDHYHISRSICALPGTKTPQGRLAA